METHPIVPASQDVLDFFENHSGFLVLGHREPDGDCVGSQLALASMLERHGRRVQPANPGPFERQEIAQYKDDFVSRITIKDLGRKPAAIIVDCSGSERLGDLARFVDDLPVLVIDHHANGTDFGDVRFVHPEVPATTILVASLIVQLGYHLDRDEASLLFLGLVTDTGFFRFLDAGETTAFRTATLLSEAGASPRNADRHLSSGRSFESRRLIGRMLERVERFGGGRVLLTYQTQVDERELGTRRDSDALYQLLLSVEHVEMIAVAKEKQEGCTVSFRSVGDIDVGILATEFGGGGHANASGAFVKDSLPFFLDRLRSRLAHLL
ncbi:MAG: DHH family phosphoesterase [Alkalispirochaeta sp.]